VLSRKELRIVKQRSFLTGIKTGLPVAFGCLPIAVAFGLLAKANGLNILAATGMSALVFAGASQFVAINLLATGAGTGEIILTTFLLNIRHFLMSAALAPRLLQQPSKVKALSSTYPRMPLENLLFFFLHLLFGFTLGLFIQRFNRRLKDIP